MAYLEFARSNPQDVAIIVRHDLAAHDGVPSAEHRDLEEAVNGVFRDGGSKACSP